MTLKEEVIFLRAENTDLKAQVSSLTQKVNTLLLAIEKLNHPKNSRNSSISPSHDLSRKNQSLRKSTGRKSGGQEGHTGSFLKQSLNPDKVVDLKPNCCKDCGTSLLSVNMINSSNRQVVDLPKIEALYTEYKQYSCICPHCQKAQKAPYPKEVSAPIQYGINVKSLVSYLSVYQYLPYARLKEFLADGFSMPISEGTIQNILKYSADKMKYVYDEIYSELSTSKVVGSDETGVKIDGRKGWIWAWQNEKNTYFVPSFSRGYNVIDEVWDNGLPNSILISDRWKAQLKTETKGHQICLAHLLRDLNYIIEIEKHSFATKFKRFVGEVFKLKADEKECDLKLCKSLEETLQKLLKLKISQKRNPKSVTFQRELGKISNYILPCIYDKNIPPDNNGSERAVRNFKVKLKVSGQFKTEQNSFCIIRSVIDTIKKRGLKVLPMICDIVAVDQKGLATT